MSQLRKHRTYPIPPADRPVLSIYEAAGLLGVGETTIREAIRIGTLPHTRLGRRILIRRIDLDKLVEPVA